jgi:hypothetical protein
MRCVVCCLQVWDPEAKADTSVQHNQHRHKLTPYGDLALKGKVLATYVAGHKVSQQALGLLQCCLISKCMRRHHMPICGWMPLHVPDSVWLPK